MTFVRKIFFVSIVITGGGAIAVKNALPETHEFRIKGIVNYRCYGGYDKTKIVKDSQTGMICDNKTYFKTLVDKIVPIRIQFSPNPDDEQTLSGGWEEKNEFMGRSYVIAVSLFKNDPLGKPNYRIRFVAFDRSPHHRTAATFTEFSKIKQMDPLTVTWDSQGTPEEIRFSASIEPK